MFGALEEIQSIAAALAAPARPLRVAGRVLEVSGASVILADAFGSLAVDLEVPHPIAPGDLAVFAGTPRNGVLAGARLVERIVPRRPPRGRAPSADPPASETDRLIHRGAGKALARRAAALAAIRACFDERGFLEVETPCLVPSPGLDLHLDAFAVRGGPSAARYLITSPEYQMKRLLAGGVPRCFQLARCFRRGEHGRTHNPEFTMLEWYRAFAGVEEVIGRHRGSCVRGRGSARTRSAARRRLRGAVRAAHRGRGVRALRRRARRRGDRAGVAATRSASSGSSSTRSSRRSRGRLAPSSRSTTLPRSPRSRASAPAIRACAERFELYVGGVELCNGFGELTDPAEQRARLERDQAERARLGKPVYPIDERFLAALEEGMPPSAGNALGVDRLIALCRGRGCDRGCARVPSRVAVTGRLR